MNKFLSYVGGLIGSVLLSNVSIGWSYLSFLDTVFGVIALLGGIVFSVALIWEGAKALIIKE